MKRSILFIIAATGLTLCSCKPTITHHEEGSPQLISLNQNVTEIPCQEVHPSIDSCTYIVLETNDNCLMGNIRTLRFRDDRFFMLDENDHVFVFDKSGKFLNTIGRKGNGPGEYIRIRSIFVNPEKEQITLIEPVRKMRLIYNYQGELLEEAPIPIDGIILGAIKKADYLGNGRIICECGAHIKSDMGIFTCNEDFSDMEVLYENDLTSKGLFSIFNSPFFIVDSASYFLKPLCDTLYRYSNSNRKIEASHLLVLKNPLPKGFVRNGQDFFEVRKELGAKGYRPLLGVVATERYCILTGFFGSLIWDLKENKGTLHGSCAPYVNDARNPNISITETMGKDFIAVLTPGNILNYRDEKLVTSPKAAALKSRLKEDDNGAIIIYHMKP
ncbi:MAG: 6-bladed beta-propeller [Bacteroidales bacterium]